MPENAEIFFYDSPQESNTRPRQHRLALHYPHLYQLRYRDNPQKRLFK